MNDRMPSTSAPRRSSLAQIAQMIERAAMQLKAAWTPALRRSDATAREPNQHPDGEALARLQALFDGALNGILLADDQGTYVDANPAICSLLGYARSELVGMSAQQLVVSDAQPATLWRRFLDERRQVGRVALRHKNGQAQLVDYMATAHVQPGLHLSVLEDATKRSETESTLHRAQQKLLALKEQHHERFEEFRAGLARDIHDELGQTLVALQLEADRLQALSPTSAQRIRELVTESMCSVRQLSLALRPAALDLGLVPALKALAVDTTRRSDMDVVTEFPAFLPPLPAVADLMLFRIAQEALNNTMRHADASHVCLSLSLSQDDDALTLEIGDDGCGFEPNTGDSAGGFGLLGMRERAEVAGAELAVISAPGSGALVRVRWSMAAQKTS